MQGYCLTIRIAWSRAWLHHFSMFLSSTFRVLGAILTFSAVVSGLGSSCSAPLGAGTSASTDPYWLEKIKHQGTSPFNANPSSYAVFRNVKVWCKSFEPWSKLLTVFPFEGFWCGWRWCTWRYCRDQVKWTFDLGRLLINLFSPVPPYMLAIDAVVVLANRPR